MPQDSFASSSVVLPILRSEFAPPTADLGKLTRLFCRAVTGSGNRSKAVAFRRVASDIALYKECVLLLQTTDCTLAT